MTSLEPEEFRREVDEFLASAVEKGVACPTFGGIMPPAMFDEAKVWQQHCFEHGFAGIDWPEEYGGRGLSTAHAMIWSEECARRGITAYMNFQGFILAGGAIKRFGTDGQKAKYLRATLAADLVWCQLFSEPEAGSDLVSLTTRADRVDDGWLVTGQKVWSSTAQLADVAILLARTDPENKGHRGISFFLFDMKSPGVEVRPIKQMTGDSEFCEVFLDEAHVPEEDLLGPENGGWAVATSVLADERTNVGAAGIGLKHTLSRLGALAADAGSVGLDRLAELTVRANSLIRLLERSGGDVMLGPLTKLALTELDRDITCFAVDVGGASAMLTSETGTEFLYAPGMRVAGGTSEIQRNLVGERLLGLPREPRPR